MALAKAREIPIVLDLGSGALVDTEAVSAIPHEFTIAEGLAAGVDLACISGDKLLGGPQAGIIAGRRDLVAALKKNPLFRALRCDKMVFAALEESVLAYLESSENPEVLLMRMVSEDVDTLRKRAEAIATKLGNSALQVGKGVSRCGGGTMPKAEIPSITLDIRPNGKSLAVAAKQLRMWRVPIVVYLSEDCLKIDLRTVFPEQDSILIQALNNLLETDR